jgi:hypothetical protein
VDKKSFELLKFIRIFITVVPLHIIGHKDFKGCLTKAEVKSSD